MAKRIRAVAVAVLLGGALCCATNPPPPAQTASPVDHRERLTELIILVD